MNSDKIVVMSAEKKPYDMEYIQNLRRQAHASVDAIKEKPTLTALYETVDKCWENPAFIHQTQFKNKDQHYAYITEYYHEVIEKMDLEQYKKLVLSDLMNRIDAAAALLTSDKILSAAKEHKKQEDMLLSEYKDRMDDLKQRNDDVMKDILKHD